MQNAFTILRNRKKVKLANHSHTRIEETHRTLNREHDMRACSDTHSFFFCINVYQYLLITRNDIIFHDKTLTCFDATLHINMGGYKKGDKFALITLNCVKKNIQLCEWGETNTTHEVQPVFSAKQLNVM